jgi:hypothetical protein
MMQMGKETTQETPARAGYWIPLLELAVPVLSFGGAFLALFFSGLGSTVDIRYFAAGCVMASCILAYLAWIRPRKDIVALTTPLYSFLFFIMPSEITIDLVLEFLYAVSLTILLIRLKFWFGAAPADGMAEGNCLEEPIRGYCGKVREHAAGLSPAAAHRAAAGVIWFAQGEYRKVAEAADAALADPDCSGRPVLATAFAIIREQALQLEDSKDQPEQFIEFTADDAGVLAKPLPPEDNINNRFEVSLENALLLLYAIAWNASEEDHPVLLSAQGFALKLIAP